MLYKEGDKVVILESTRGHWNSNSIMHEYIGKTMTIRDTSIGTGARMLEDDGRWYWEAVMFRVLPKDQNLI